jgi:CheY-like chemotaxis protein
LASIDVASEDTEYYKLAYMRKRVMLVDDDEDDIDIFREALKEVDIEIELITANNGQDALDLVLEKKVMPDHIFLDINMPLMNGIDTLEQFSARKKIPPPGFTIYTTSNKGFKGYDRCIELGAHYLQKPNSYSSLVDTLKSRLKLYSLL